MGMQEGGELACCQLVQLDICRYAQQVGENMRLLEV